MQKFPAGKFHAAPQGEEAIAGYSCVAQIARPLWRAQCPLLPPAGVGIKGALRLREARLGGGNFAVSELRSMSVNHSSTLTAAIATMEPSNFCLSPENPILIRPGGQV